MPTSRWWWRPRHHRHPEGRDVVGPRTGRQRVGDPRPTGGTGTWLLVLPTYHIAGLQVLIRSVLAGTVPVELDVTYGFDPAGLPDAVAAMGSGGGTPPWWPRSWPSVCPTEALPPWRTWMPSCSVAGPPRPDPGRGCRSGYLGGPHLRHERDRRRLRVRRHAARRGRRADRGRRPNRAGRRDAGQRVPDPPIGPVRRTRLVPHR
jgi:hypothetical protein